MNEQHGVDDLGSSYFQNRKFLQSLPDVRWNVVEQPHYVDAGRKYIEEGCKN
jgi:putative methyltransferase (TIGR04325 family)